MTRRRLPALALLLAGLAAPAAAQTMPSVIFFESHSARFDDAGEAILRGVAAEARGGATVEIRGFADPEGGIPYNRALSLARAEHAAHLLREMGVAPGQLRILVRGPVEPILDGQESRRIEIRLIR